MPNNEFISSRNRTLVVSPLTLKLQAGDTSLLQVYTDLKDYDVTIYPDDIVSYDREYNEVLALKEGIATISFSGTEDGVKHTQNVICVIEQKEVTADNKIKIMLHNRNTNRLTTIEAAVTEDLNLRLPEKEGTLVTDGFVKKAFSPIKTPKIINVKEHTQFFIHQELQASPFETIDTVKTDENKYKKKKYLHTGSIWQFADDKNFTKIITEKYHRTGDLTKCGHERFGLQMWVRVKYVSREEYQSEWSEPVRIQTGIDLGYYQEDKRKTWRDHGGRDIQLQPIEKNVKPDAWNGALLQVIPWTKLWWKRIYFGRWDLKRNDQSNYYNPTDVVKHNSKYWYSLIQFNGNQEPGTDGAKWAEYNFYHIPGSFDLYTHLGLPYNCNDAHPTHYTFGANSVGMDWSNQNKDVISYIFRGKVCFTYTRRSCYNISHVDCFISHLKKSDRTIKIHEKTFYVRLMREDEHKNILLPLAKDPRNQIELYDNELLETTEDIPTGRVGHKNGTYEDIDPKNRIGSLRLVLELIPEGSEPFKHWTYSKRAYFHQNHPEGLIKRDEFDYYEDIEDLPETFYYDPDTDTGTFGIFHQSVDNDGSASGTFSEEIAFKRGSVDYGQIEDSWLPYMKFYWHGQIVYINGKSSVANIRVSDLYLSNRRAIWPFDIGTSREAHFHAKVCSYDKDKTKYYQGMMQGIRHPIASWWNNNVYQDNAFMGTDCIYTDLYPRAFDITSRSYYADNGWTRTVGHHAGDYNFVILGSNFAKSGKWFLTVAPVVYGDNNVNNRNNTFARTYNVNKIHNTNAYHAGANSSQYQWITLLWMYVAKPSRTLPVNEFGYVSDYITNPTAFRTV